MNPGIYIISTPHNSMLYVGKSDVDWRRRSRDHYKPSNQSRLGRTLRKHGGHLFGYDCDNPCVQEQWLINFFGGPGGKLYNLQEGGTDGYRHSPETRAKISSALMGNRPSERVREMSRVRATGNSYHLGHMHGELARGRMRAARLNAYAERVVDTLMSGESYTRRKKCSSPHTKMRLQQKETA